MTDPTDEDYENVAASIWLLNGYGGLLMFVLWVIERWILERRNDGNKTE